MSINLRETFQEVSWAEEPEVSAMQLAEEHAFNYGLKGGAENIGLMGRTNETDDASDKSDVGKRKKERQLKDLERHLQDAIDRAMDSLLDDMRGWSPDKVSDFANNYVSYLEKKREAAYESGNMAEYLLLTERIDRLNEIGDMPEGQEQADAYIEAFEDEPAEDLHNATVQMEQEGKIETSPETQALLEAVNDELASSADKEHDAQEVATKVDFNDFGL